MSTTQDRSPLGLHGPQRPGESFAEFCGAEAERRKNSGEEFDSALFDEAVDLVMRKLQKLEDEGPT